MVEQISKQLPNPDPTFLTTENLLREIDHVKELFTERIDGLEDKVESYKESHADLHSHRLVEVQAEITHLTELCAERFGGIEKQILERDARTTESSRSGKDAIAAALDSQQKAVEKSEKATEKELDSIKTNFATTVKSLETQINDIKANVNQSGGVITGQKQTKEEGARMVSLGFAAVMAIIAIISVIVAVNR